MRTMDADQFATQHPMTIALQAELNTSLEGCKRQLSTKTPSN